jgi:hypothetical protein
LAFGRRRLYLFDLIHSLEAPASLRTYTRYSTRSDRGPRRVLRSGQVTPHTRSRTFSVCYLRERSAPAPLRPRHVPMAARQTARRYWEGQSRVASDDPLSRLAWCPRSGQGHRRRREAGRTIYICSKHPSCDHASLHIMLRTLSRISAALLAFAADTGASLSTADTALIRALMSSSDPLAGA